MTEAFERGALLSGAKLETVTKTLSVYQKKGVFAFGTDAVLLAAYAASHIKATKGRTLFDLCAGTGIIGLLLADRFPALTVRAVEVNADAAAMSLASAEKSGLAARFFPACLDVKDVPKTYVQECADYIVVNPPYMTADSGFACEDDYKNVARHEILCTLDDVFSAAFHLLKTGGDCFVVYRPERLSTPFSAAKNNRFEVKSMTYVHTRQSAESRLVLCKARKGASEGMHISPPLFLYREDGAFSDAYLEIREKGVTRFD